MKTRLAIRGYVAGRLQLSERLDVEENGSGIEQLAERHALTLLALPAGECHMIEIEFLDEPNALERYFRIGTDPAMMVQPIAIAHGQGAEQ
jgi:hypothetical protein